MPAFQQQTLTKQMQLTPANVPCAVGESQHWQGHPGVTHCPSSALHREGRSDHTVTRGVMSTGKTQELSLPSTTSIHFLLICTNICPPFIVYRM